MAVIKNPPQNIARVLADCRPEWADKSVFLPETPRGAYSQLTSRRGLKRYVKTASAIAREVRTAIPDGNLLFHGTRYAVPILKTNILLYGRLGYPKKNCLTRRLPVAAYWALLPRDETEEFGAIFVLDRDLLATKYEIEPFRDNCWDGDPELQSIGDEAEEAIFGRDIRDLHKYVVRVILLGHGALLPNKRTRVGLQIAA